LMASWRTTFLCSILFRHLSVLLTYKSWQVAGSTPDDVIGIFPWHNPSGRTMVLRLTQHLTEMRTRNISWGVKVGGA
jgi:hypothetical protein